MSRRRPRIPGTSSLRGPTVIVFDDARYVAPRLGTVPANGRVARRAVCGHDVYLSERGLHAVTRRGKRLYCDACWSAVMTEHGAQPIIAGDEGSS